MPSRVKQASVKAVAAPFPQQAGADFRALFARLLAIMEEAISG
jgi:hypothetical protein